jgi:nitrogen fixation protein NifU and related proteins
MADFSYSQVILEHYRHPRNQGAMEGASMSEEGVNPLCGDRVRIQLKLEGDTVLDARFTANACAICVASASVLTDLVQGAPLDEVETLNIDDLIRTLDARLPKTRIACVSLPLTVMHAAVNIYRRGASRTGE